MAAREEERQLQSMFDKAWDSLSPEERVSVTAERERWLDAAAGGGVHALQAVRRMQERSAESMASERTPEEIDEEVQTARRARRRSS